MTCLALLYLNICVWKGTSILYPFIPILKHWQTFILSFNSNKTFVLTFATETLSRSWSPTTASLFAFRLTPWWFNIKYLIFNIIFNILSWSLSVSGWGLLPTVWANWSLASLASLPRARSHPGPGPLAPASPSEILDLGLQQTLVKYYLSLRFLFIQLYVLLSLDKYACI